MEHGDKAADIAEMYEASCEAGREALAAMLRVANDRGVDPYTLVRMANSQIQQYIGWMPGFWVKPDQK